MVTSRVLMAAIQGKTWCGSSQTLGRCTVRTWHRQVCVKMASTALIFSALQPVRLAVHLPIQHQVAPGWIARGNHSSLPLYRQCLSTSGAVLLETRECADGSIMYKFGSPDQIHLEGAVADSAPDQDEGQRQAQLTTETSGTDGLEPQLPGESISVEQPVVIVNGVQHSSSQSADLAEISEGDSTSSDVRGKLDRLVLGEVQTDSATADRLASSEGPAEDRASPESPELGFEAKEKEVKTKDEAGKEEKAAYLRSGAAMIPDPAKAARGGEDAFFIEGTRWIGVADGVGGWAEDGAALGINAGDYARELMWNCAEIARKSEKDSSPKIVLFKSFTETKALGSTTVVVAAISNQTLNVVNMGDTGFLVIRNGTIFDRSQPMLRGFNFPYQIGSQGDDPLLAKVYSVPVQNGDVIVLASDGLFDNLFQYEIVSFINKLVKEGCGPEVVAEKLASYAHQNGARKTGSSPFGQEAQAVGYNYSGGKMDDITVVVSFVCDAVL